MSKKKKTGSKPDEKTAELDAAVADTAETTASVDASIAEAEETQDAGPGKLGREGLEDQVVAAMAAAKADVEFEGSVIKVYGETPAAAKDNAAVVWRTIDSPW